MKQLFLATALSLLAVPAFAQVTTYQTAEYREPLFIGGQKLSDLKEKQDSKQTKVLLNVNKRLNDIEDKQAEWESFWSNYSEGLSVQLAEIERRLAGVQKQVTVLHAKKEDK